MRGPGQEKAPPPTDTEKRFKNEKNDLDLRAAFAEFLCVRSNPGDGIFLLMLQLNKLVCCSKGWTSLRCFFLNASTIAAQRGWTSLRSFF